MKATGIAVLLVAAAAFCAGMIDTNEYDTKEYNTVAVTGECLDDIAARYYKQDDRRIVWDEFRHEVWAKNKGLTANGRYLQAGDQVIVEVKKIAKK